MIVITKRKNSFTVKGHAGFAECEKDIVCAGVSILAQNFIESVERLTNDLVFYTQTTKDGYLRVDYEELSEKAETLLASFFIGVEMIIEKYPEYVRLTE